MTYSDELIDRRVLKRNIAKGKVDPDKYAAQLEALPDVESNAAIVLGEEEAEASAEAAVEDTPEVVTLPWEFLGAGYQEIDIGDVSGGGLVAGVFNRGRMKIESVHNRIRVGLCHQ